MRESAVGLVKQVEWWRVIMRQMMPSGDGVAAMRHWRRRSMQQWQIEESVQRILTTDSISEWCGCHVASVEQTDRHQGREGSGQVVSTWTVAVRLATFESLFALAPLFQMIKMT